jgi:acetyl-CoA synthetase
MLTPATSYGKLVDTFAWLIPERYNIGVDVCDRWAREPGRTALIHKAANGEVSEYSFAEIARLSNQAANLLTALGLQPGDRVAIMLPQDPQTAVAHVATYKMAAIAVPLSTLFGVEALEYRLRDSGARAVITDAAGAEKIRTLRPALPELKFVLVTGPRSPADTSWDDRLARQSSVFTPVDTLADDPALIIYTSGTTGPPKGALHAHRVLLGHLPGVEMSHDFLPAAGDRFWTPADWAWIGGLYDVLMPAWHHGLPVVSHRFTKFDPEAVFQLIADLQIRNAFLPPTALKMMRAVANPRNRWSYAMRSIASGGEPLGAQILHWGRETFGLTINEFYGQTECNMVISSAGRLMDPKPGRMGRPVPGHRVAVVDATGNPCAPGVLGNIAVRAPDPVMFLGYWKNERATRDKFCGQWLLTGDTGEVDPDGFLRFVGRDDDVISSGGYRIGPGEIEDCLLRHPAVKLVAVVGVADATRSEIIKAFIVLNESHVPGNDLRADLQQHVRHRLAAHEYPREIEFVASLPMTTTGKVMRRVLRRGAVTPDP